ncbi:hypothetical protein K9M79_03400 [Candidatus Woesearchaeota archaeon]|nr:hypothetical protein [Candidatus Woesearchaeota archaeon]
MVNDLLVTGTLIIIAISAAIGIMYYLRLKSLWKLATSMETEPKRSEPVMSTTQVEKKVEEKQEIRTNKIVRKTSPAQIFADLEHFKQKKIKSE